MNQFAKNLNEMSNAELAETLAGGYGLFVFPCHEKTSAFVGADGREITVRCKSPRKTHKGAVIIPDGMKSASNEFETVADWWQLWPGALIGINLKMSGLIAIDCDVPGASHPDLTVNGVTEFTRLLTAAGAVGTPCLWEQNTPSGGAQVLYTFPQIEGVPGALCPGIDIKHDGYVCSGRLADGRRYSWEYAPMNGSVNVSAPVSFVCYSLCDRFPAGASGGGSARLPITQTPKKLRECYACPAQPICLYGTHIPHFHHRRFFRWLSGGSVRFTSCAGYEWIRLPAKPRRAVLAMGRGYVAASIKGAREI